MGNRLSKNNLFPSWGEPRLQPCFSLCALLPPDHPRLRVAVPKRVGLAAGTDRHLGPGSQQPPHPTQRKQRAFREGSCSNPISQGKCSPAGLCLPRVSGWRGRRAGGQSHGPGAGGQGPRGPLLPQRGRCAHRDPGTTQGAEVTLRWFPAQPQDSCHLGLCSRKLCAPAMNPEHVEPRHPEGAQPTTWGGIVNHVCVNERVTLCVCVCVCVWGATCLPRPPQPRPQAGEEAQEPRIVGNRPALFPAAEVWGGLFGQLVN